MFLSRISEQSLFSKSVTCWSLRAGVNFINVLRAAFRCADPKSAKRYFNQQCRFMLLGPMSVKSVHKMFIKLTPGVDFTNVFMYAFSVQKCLLSFYLFMVCPFNTGNIRLVPARIGCFFLSKYFFHNTNGWF